MSSIKQAQDIKALELRVLALERLLNGPVVRQIIDSAAAIASPPEREPLKLKGRA